MNLIGNHFTISQLFVLKQDLAAVVVERDMQSTLEKPWREKNYNFIVWCKYSSLAGTIGIWNSVSFFLTPEVLPFAGIELAEKPGFLIVVAQHIEHKCDKKWG